MNRSKSSTEFRHIPNPQHQYFNYKDINEEGVSEQQEKYEVTYQRDYKINSNDLGWIKILQQKDQLTNKQKQNRRRVSRNKNLFKKQPFIYTLNQVTDCNRKFKTQQIDFVIQNQNQQNLEICYKYKSKQKTNHPNQMCVRNQVQELRRGLGIFNDTSHQHQKYAYALNCQRENDRKLSKFDHNFEDNVNENLTNKPQLQKNRIKSKQKQHALNSKPKQKQAQNFQLTNLQYQDIQEDIQMRKGYLQNCGQNHQTLKRILNNKKNVYFNSNKFKNKNMHRSRRNKNLNRQGKRYKDNIQCFNRKQKQLQFVEASQNSNKRWQAEEISISSNFTRNFNTQNQYISASLDNQYQNPINFDFNTACDIQASFPVDKFKKSNQYAKVQLGRYSSLQTHQSIYINQEHQDQSTKQYQQSQKQLTKQNEVIKQKVQSKNKEKEVWVNKDRAGDMVKEFHKQRTKQKQNENIQQGKQTGIQCQKKLKVNRERIRTQKRNRNERDRDQKHDNKQIILLKMKAKCLQGGMQQLKQQKNMYAKKMLEYEIEIDKLNFEIQNMKVGANDTTKIIGNNVSASNNNTVVSNNQSQFNSNSYYTSKNNSECIDLKRTCGTNTKNTNINNDPNCCPCSSCAFNVQIQNFGYQNSNKNAYIRKFQSQQCKFQDSNLKLKTVNLNQNNNVYGSINNNPKINRNSQTAAKQVRDSRVTIKNSENKQQRVTDSAQYNQESYESQSYQNQLQRQLKNIKQSIALEKQSKQQIAEQRDQLIKQLNQILHKHEEQTTKLKEQITVYVHKLEGIQIQNSKLQENQNAYKMKLDDFIRNVDKNHNRVNELTMNYIEIQKQCGQALMKYKQKQQQVCHVLKQNQSLNQQVEILVQSLQNVKYQLQFYRNRAIELQDNIIPAKELQKQRIIKQLNMQFNKQISEWKSRVQQLEYSCKKNQQYKEKYLAESQKIIQYQQNDKNQRQSLQKLEEQIMIISRYAEGLQTEMQELREKQRLLQQKIRKISLSKSIDSNLQLSKGSLIVNRHPQQSQSQSTTQSHINNLYSPQQSQKYDVFMSEICCLLRLQYNVQYAKQEFGYTAFIQQQILQQLQNVLQINKYNSQVAYDYKQILQMFNINDAQNEQIIHQKLIVQIGQFRSNMGNLLKKLRTLQRKVSVLTQENKKYIEMIKSGYGEGVGQLERLVQEQNQQIIKYRLYMFNQHLSQLQIGKKSF